MKVETKFNIGDKVHVVIKTKIDKKCDFCGGKGLLLVNGLTNESMSAVCPKCKGNGLVGGQFGILSSRIGGIEIKKHENSKTEIYYLIETMYGYTIYNEHELYETAEEAYAEAERRNAE